MAANGSEFVTLSQLKTSIDSIDTSSSSIDAYPVGSIYMSVNSTSPASLFGGTWQQIKDRFLMCAGSTYKAGGTGGEASHTLTVEEMPSHSHAIMQYSVNYAFNPGTGGLKDDNDNIFYNGSRVIRSRVTTATTGSGSAHNNNPPYLSVYVWKRTA